MVFTQNKTESLSSSLIPFCKVNDQLCQVESFVNVHKRKMNRQTLRNVNFIFRTLTLLQRERLCLEISCGLHMLDCFSLRRKTNLRKDYYTTFEILREGSLFVECMCVLRRILKSPSTWILCYKGVVSLVIL